MSHSPRLNFSPDIDTYHVGMGLLEGAREYDIYVKTNFLAPTEYLQWIHTHVSPSSQLKVRWSSHSKNQTVISANNLVTVVV